jgi:hypothetical protein
VGANSLRNRLNACFCPQANAQAGLYFAARDNHFKRNPVIQPAIGFAPWSPAVC